MQEYCNINHAADVALLHNFAANIQSLIHETYSIALCT